jgi:hypothetical protein
MKINAYACLVFPASWNADDEPDECGWRPGPLPIPIPATSAQGTRAGAARVADREARATYFAPRVHDQLYGTTDPAAKDAPKRWHRTLETGAQDEGGSRVQAWELLTHEAGLGIAVAHVQLGADAAPALAALTVTRGPGRQWLESALDDQLKLAPERPRVISHLLWAGEEMPEPYDSVAVINSLKKWNTVERWEWFLASGLGPEDVLPDTQDPNLRAGQVWLSRDWQALVLRDGMAYVALTPYGPGPAGERTFHDPARVYVRSIYLDVLLLGILQLNAVREYADAVSRVRIDDEPVELAKGVEDLEAGLFRLRTGLWWRDVTRSGGPARDLLNAFQRQHHLPDLYTQIVADLTDMSRYVQARRASLDEAARAAREAARDAEEQARQRFEDRQHQTERAVALISFVLLPVSLIFAATSEWAAPSPTLFWVSAGVSALILAVMLIRSKTLREALFRR